MSRPMTGTRAVSRTAIPGGANQADVNTADLRIIKRYMRQAHESRDAGEAGQVETGDWREVDGVGHAEP